MTKLTPDTRLHVQDGPDNEWETTWAGLQADQIDSDGVEIREIERQFERHGRAIIGGEESKTATITLMSDWRVDRAYKQHCGQILVPATAVSGIYSAGGEAVRAGCNDEELGQIMRATAEAVNKAMSVFS